jgi:lipopolysaccharide/colanic/teichoic acid biosynthesis glycosyltransferase
LDRRGIAQPDDGVGGLQVRRARVRAGRIDEKPGRGGGRCVIRPRSKERIARTAVLAAGDFLIAWGGLAAVVELRRNVSVAFTKSLLPENKFVLDPPNVLLFGFSLLVALVLSGFYRDRVTPRTRPSILVAVLIQVALVAIGSTAIARPLPRTVLFAVPLIEILALPLWRWVLQAVAPIRGRDTILLGAAHDIEEAVTGLSLMGDRRIRVIDQISPSYEGLAEPALRKRLRDAGEVICVSPDTDPRVRLELLRIRGPRGFLMLASNADALLASSMLGWIGDQPLVEVAVGCGFGVSAAIKRSIDIVIALLLSIVAAPVVIFTAIAIWIDDRGPVFIRQKRVGLGGEEFWMWKFRSMRGPAEPEPLATREEIERSKDRLTRVGAFMRPYHLDELLQLLNVLSGDMSLVGPRPERPEIMARILRDVPDFDLRCLVRPGMAGLAQVSAEYDSRPEVKLRYDLMYMCNWSVWLDLRLMLRAVSTSLSGTGL